MRRRRNSGILLSLTSLPSEFGVGDLGPSAYSFVDFLQSANQRLWQFLPIHPTILSRGNSPYDSASFFAGNPLLIGLTPLIQDGLLSPELAGSAGNMPEDFVDYTAVYDHRRQVWAELFGRWSGHRLATCYEEFCEANGAWLEDYAMFVVLRRMHDELPWWQWPEPFRRRRPETIRRARQDFAEQIRNVCILQFLFDQQWKRLRRHCNSRGIRLIGDLPLYPSHDSADVWAAPDLFELDNEFQMIMTAGSPPSLFNPAGQSWGVPVYRWENVLKTNCRWWIRRLERMLELFDLLRWDHFQGVLEEWQMAPGQSPREGRDIPGPGREFMDVLHKHFGTLPVIPEVIARPTPQLNELMMYYELPQMRLLQLSFSGSPGLNPHAPHNYRSSNIVAYTGTHDLPPIRGWWNTISAEERGRIERYVGHPVDEHSAAWELIRLSSASIADTAIYQLQDVLNLGADAQMNFPGTLQGNWVWRFREEQLTGELAGRLAEVTRIYNRT